MKRIEAIIRPDRVSGVFNALKKIGHPGVMISEIEGHGNQEGLNIQVRGNTYKVDLITKARVEVIVKESETEMIIKAICDAAFTGEIGDGKIFVHPVDDAMRVRTGERGECAI
ncbi:MAG TPA: P-II family nitrogen regulator [Desulfomonilia bacterium]|nr:P-II family nitrogen regulator [Desulfomonilia bacterium]